jgi:hypothetical protein
MVPVLLVLPPACGSSGGAVSGEFGAKCEIACKPPAGVCATEDPADCQRACVVATEGLSVACAQCIAEGTGWSGQTCSCSGGNCSMNFFGSGGEASTSGGSTCDPVADTKCLGFSVESITGVACKSICAAK